MKIMVEVLGIFAIVTKELKHGRASELISDDTLHVAHRDSEKYLKKLIGRKDIEDALSRLDRLTQEEARMATVQVLKLAHCIRCGMETVGDKMKSLDDKVDLAIEGTLISLDSIKLPSYNYIQLDGKVVKSTTIETKALMQQTADNMDEDRRS